MTAPLLVLLLLELCEARPQVNHMVVAATTTTTTASPKESEETTTVTSPDAKPVITQFLIRSDVQFRYARTRVESYVKNPASAAQKVAFSLVMPNSAFVSNFSMLIGEIEYVAEVKEKEEAQETFDKAVDEGRGAGLVNQDTRDANLISVSVNVEPGSKVRFALTYEELLERKLGRYEHIIHLNPGQIVDNFQVDVAIAESLPVEQVRVPKLKVDPNSITSQDPNPLATITRDPLDPSKVDIQFVVDRAAQKELSSQGVNGQFIVQYDVDSQGEEGDIQLLDGYFVHFFSPDRLATLPKHVVFVLDVSGSMHGTKLDQTKDAMVTVLDDMTDQDYFNIITFSDNVYHWAPEAEKEKEAPHNLTFPGTEEMREEALTYALQLRTIGGTNINDGMLAALELIRAVRQAEELPSNVRPIVIFLTDGEPTTGVTDGDQINANVLAANADLEVPIYGLAFGAGADFSLIKKLSLANGAFARRIYEGSDAAIQLEDFYAQIANPLLANVEFEYVGEALKNNSVTKTTFGTFNRGNEFVVSGKINLDNVEEEELEVIIKGNGIVGDFKKSIKICLRPMPDFPMAMPKAADEEDLPSDGLVDDAELTEEEDTEVLRGISVTDNIITRPRPVPLPMPIPPPFPDRCIPLPPPKPRDPRSEHENFIERLWAFMSIKELLDEKKTKTQERREELMADVSTTTTTTTTGIPPVALPKAAEQPEEKPEAIDVLDDIKIPKKKTNKERAIDLALRYNFVTPVTSLVVEKPDENATEAIKPIPVSSATFFRGQGCPSCFSSRRMVSSTSFRHAARPMMSPMPISRMGGGPRRKVAHAAPAAAGGASAHFQVPITNVMSRLPPTRPPGRHHLPTTSRTFAYDAADLMDMDMGAFYDDFEEATTTTTAKTTCSGKIFLYSKTYRRGKEVELDTDMEDLSDIDFDNRLKSLKVEGDCCWRIFVDAAFGGTSMIFRAGEYDSASKLASLVNKASSVQRLLQC